MKIKPVLGVGVLFFIFHSALAFEGRITVALTRSGPAAGLLYTVGTNYLRLEETNTDRPHACDVLNRQTGELTILFPHNRTFVQLSGSAVTPALSNAPGSLSSPGPGPGANNISAMPMRPVEKMELTARGETTNLLGLACARYEIKHRGQTMVIWATDQLFAFQPYQQGQPPRFGPRLIEQQWGELIKARKLFPLLAVLKSDDGAERLRFEVTSITPGNVPGESVELFQPPPGYIEIPPLPF